MYMVVLISVLSVFSIDLILRGHCVPRNSTATKHNTTEIDRTGEFDLTKIQNLNESEFDRNYFKIINTMRRMGPESLHLINRSDLISVAFQKGDDETSAELKTRWESCCDHFTLDGTQQQFKSFVLQRVYKPPPAQKPPKKPPTHVRTLLSTEDAVVVA